MCYTHIITHPYNPGVFFVPWAGSVARFDRLKE